MLLSSLLSQCVELPTQAFAEGLVFGEGPRFRDGELYVSDMLGKKIFKISEDGKKTVVVEVEQQPNGMDFLPDGSLVYASMFDQKVYRLSDGHVSLYADLSSVFTGYSGDMVVDRAGRLYVDDTGGRVLHGGPRQTARIAIVEPDGTFRVGAENINFANGIGIDCAGTSLYVSASSDGILNKFDIGEGGILVNRREIWNVKSFTDAKNGTSIDGICIDAEDGIWLSLLAQEMFVRLDRDGRLTHVVNVPGHAAACALGGQDGKTLYCVTNNIPESCSVFEAMMQRKTECTILTARVQVPRGTALP